MTVKQAEAAAGTLMIPCSPISSCYRVTPADAPDGIGFVVNEGTIERVDIANGPITTRSGVGVGTSVAVGKRIGFSSGYPTSANKMKPMQQTVYGPMTPF